MNSDAGQKGVYFRFEDYAGFWRRLITDLADLLVAGSGCFVVLAIVYAVFPSPELLLLDWAVVLFCYFVLLKQRSKTVGFLVGRVRIVTLHGDPPGILTLTFRLLFGVLGPLNWMIDLLWLSGDPHRQALRDKLAGTYVVKRNAQPAGTGKIVRRYYDLLGYNFICKEVEAAADGEG